MDGREQGHFFVLWEKYLAGAQSNTKRNFEQSPRQTARLLGIKGGVLPPGPAFLTGGP
jgi:hypothetical protein